MNRRLSFRRVCITVLMIAFALMSLSCGGSSGMGMGMNYPTRWGGNNGRPPVFVGGPS